MSVSKPELSVMVRAFQSILNKKCWALSNGKKPWDYNRGFGLAWSDLDLLVSFWEATDLLYEQKTHGAGIGLFLGVENQISCLDLDGAMVDGKMLSNEITEHIVHGSATFTEISLSEKGLHLFYEVDNGTEPFHLKAGVSGKGGDFFTQKRFIRLTGQIYDKEHPIRYLPSHHVEFFREKFGKITTQLPVAVPFTGNTSDRALASRLSGACIPFKRATIKPQPFHNDHGGIVECIETVCPNIKAHTTEASPNARFVRCADGLITGRCFHGHCEPEVLRAAGTSLTGMLSTKIRAAGDPTIVYTLLEKCGKMGMLPLKDFSRMTEARILSECERFLQGVP